MRVRLPLQTMGAGLDASDVLSDGVVARSGGAPAEVERGSQGLCAKRLPRGELGMKRKGSYVLGQIRTCEVLK